MPLTTVPEWSTYPHICAIRFFRYFFYSLVRKQDPDETRTRNSEGAIRQVVAIPTPDVSGVSRKTQCANGSGRVHYLRSPRQGRARWQHTACERRYCPAASKPHGGSFFLYEGQIQSRRVQAERQVQVSVHRSSCQEVSRFLGGICDWNTVSYPHRNWLTCFLTLRSRSFASLTGTRQQRRALYLDRYAS